MKNNLCSITPIKSIKCGNYYPDQVKTIKIKKGLFDIKEFHLIMIKKIK